VQQEGGRAISLRTDLKSEVMSTAQMIPMGLIVNERVMNAIKYAFPSGKGGSVFVALKPESGELYLTVADDGIGTQSQSSDSCVGGRLIENFCPSARRARRASEQQPRDDCAPHPAPSCRLVGALPAIFCSGA
jgi:two-component sensor histidine kinase